MFLKPAPGRTVYYERSRVKLPVDGAEIPEPLSTHWHRYMNSGDVVAEAPAAPTVAGAASIAGAASVPAAPTVAGAASVEGGEHPTWHHPHPAAPSITGTSAVPIAAASSASVTETDAATTTAKGA